jgi:hypothetical protein
MNCIPLCKIPSIEKINPRLRLAVQEIIYFLYLPLPPSAHHDALCIGSDKAEIIFYIDLRKKMKECMEDCLDLQRKVVESCRENKQEEEYECPQEFIEDLERERCRGICEDIYVENAETALFKIQDRLRILDRYGIRYVERVSRPSRYEIVVKAYIDPRAVKSKA